MNLLQKRILDIFKVFDSICSEHNLRYFAIGGTAIGAVRHGGFIPWDDDLDVAMPVEDYDTLMRILPGELPPEYGVNNYANNPYTPNVFAKIEDLSTTCIEPIYRMHPEAYTGVWMDIMPMCGIPAAGVGRYLFLREAQRLALFSMFLRRPETIGGGKFNRLYYAIHRLGLARGKPSSITGDYYSFLLAHPFNDAAYTGYTWSMPSAYWPFDKVVGKVRGALLRRRDLVYGSYGLQDLIFPIGWFSGYESAPFEDTNMRMPLGWREYLTMQFGDFMTPPPEQGQVTHECFVDLENSVSKYRQGDLKVPDDFAMMCESSVEADMQ